LKALATAENSDRVAVDKEEEDRGGEDEEGLRV